MSQYLQDGLIGGLQKGRRDDYLEHRRRMSMQQLEDGLDRLQDERPLDLAGFAIAQQFPKPGRAPGG